MKDDELASGFPPNELEQVPGPVRAHKEKLVFEPPAIDGVGDGVEDIGLPDTLAAVRQ